MATNRTASRPATKARLAASNANGRAASAANGRGMKAMPNAPPVSRSAFSATNSIVAAMPKVVMAR